RAGCMARRDERFGSCPRSFQPSRESTEALALRAAESAEFRLSGSPSDCRGPDKANSPHLPDERRTAGYRCRLSDAERALLPGWKPCESAAGDSKCARWALQTARALQDLHPGWR